ncbi:hypothetical protein C8R47DRAFT_1149620 [Mycena vitilis]|nr:hypothetical protein C8R47DRAFT_1149620 [Mycena vitilis]
MQSLINAMSGNGPGSRDDYLALVRHGEPKEERTYPKQHYAPSAAMLVVPRIFIVEMSVRKSIGTFTKKCVLSTEKPRPGWKSKYSKLRADLQKFCSTFQAKFADGALYALRVHFNRLASLASAFEVALLYTPEEDKVHCRFKLVNWKCVPLALVEKCILEAIVLPTIENVVKSDPECHLFVIYRVSHSRLRATIHPNKPHSC